MGDFADTLKKHHHSDHMVSAVSKAEDVAMIVSGAAAYYGTAKEIGAQLGLWGAEPSQFDMLQAAIAEIKAAIDAAVETLLNATHKEAIDNLARTNLLASDESNDIIALLLSTVDGSVTIDEIQVLISTADPDHYLDDTAWVVEPFSGAYHDNLWSGRLQPPLIAGKLFMFSVVTPGYLRAIAKWIAGLAAVYPDPFRVNFRSLIQQHIQRIVELHTLWVSGIHRLRIPSFEEFLPQASLPSWPRPGQQWALSNAKWDTAGRMWGAVDTFTGLASIDAYEDDLPVPPDPADYPFHNEGEPPPDPSSMNSSIPSNPNAPDQPKLITDEYAKAYEAFRAGVATDEYLLIARRLKALSLREEKVVYNSLPLRNMWSMQNTLRHLIGAPAIRLPDSLGLWSMREFAEETSVDKPSDATDNTPIHRHPDQVISMRELAGRMQLLPFGPVSLRAIYLDSEQRVV